MALEQSSEIHLALLQLVTTVITSSTVSMGGPSAVNFKLASSLAEIIVLLLNDST